MRFTSAILCVCSLSVTYGGTPHVDVTDGNKEVVQAVTQAMIEGRYDDLGLYIAQNYHRHCQATPDAEVETLDDFTNLMKMYAGAFPDGKVELYELIAEGDMVAVIGTYKGTHTAPLGPYPAAGRVVDSEFAGYHRLENGKIVETWVTWDNLAMFHQLGLDPPGARTSEPELPVPVPVTFDSHGGTLHGVFYPAATDAPIATVLLLHGYPGNDREPLGLGSRMMQEGINALAFNYRGTWASEGLFRPDNALADVDSAIGYLSSPDVAEAYTIDTDNLIVVGYSFGGNMALMYSSQNAFIKRVVAIAGVNLRELARKLEVNEEFRSSWEQMIDETQSEQGMARGDGGAAANEWLLANHGLFDFVAVADELADKDLLLLGGWLDRLVTVEGHILPLYRALQEHQARDLTIEVFNDDHDFDDIRDILADRVISWIKREVPPGP